MILLATFIWLRGIQLSADDRRNSQLQVDLWIEKLFVLGFAGILTAILLPAYLLGACVLVASCGVPFWKYVTWRNAQIDDQSQRLGWQHLFLATDIPFRELPDTTLELPLSLGPGASSGTISLVGKTFSDRVANAGAQDEAGNSSGFQLALALIGHAISMRATDLHIGAKDDRVVLRLRVDGDIVSLDPLPLANGLAVINVFKVLSDLSIADKRRSQDGSFRADVEGRRLCFRVSSQGTHAGEKLSIRILDPAKNFSTFSALGISDQMEKQLQAIISRRSGLVLFAGATGAGKSTTAYAGLRYLDSGDRNIVTIEDPIEYTIPSIDQIEVKTRAGQTFQSGLRSLLRQDADVLLIGEIRDEETAKIACQAATTGQLVISTIHATDSLSAVIRMTDLGVDQIHLAAALRGVVSQLLVRRLCIECRIAYAPDADELRQLGLADFRGQLYQSPDPSTNACLSCHGRGFVGRTGIFELLDISHAIRELVRDNVGTAAILSAARDSGMTTLWESGVHLVREGIISKQEFDRAVDES
ncbi:MAG: type II/IV secretion system protein [Planctomycetaceae bacterium]|nr:type II/IV secretion system protein [Planctomycetaceae bacterium]